MPPFDLDTAARHGTSPVRMLAFYLAMAIRDRADQLTFNEDFTPGLGGSAIDYFAEGVWYGLIPPPNTIHRELIPLLRVLVGETGDQFTARLGGHEFAVRVEFASVPASPSVPRRKWWWTFIGRTEIESPTVIDRAILHLPLMPSLSPQAEELFHLHRDKDGLISLDVTEIS